MWHLLSMGRLSFNRSDLSHEDLFSPHGRVPPRIEGGAGGPA
jgi:hypothetical protein